ncbi:hypothetical protein BK704_01010 [[Bacillus thuringiensis] serovar konkukian]|nr:binary toxin-like calcium binding domain-containing protein [Bacillus thuringiensis]OUB19275.1 hypothetical protein BK704_01010 [[Bacillus thuringiensis] serovar konkukian]
MRINPIIKCVATTTLFSQFLTYSSVSYAEEKQSQTKIKQVMQSEKASQVSNESSQGLLGYYFQDSNFQQLTMMAHRQVSDLQITKKEVKNLLADDQQHIGSVRWIGYIQPSQTGDYILSTSSDQQVVIELDGKIILNQSSMTEAIQLEKGKPYKIRIEYVPENKKNKDNLLDFELNWSISGGTAEPVPDNDFLLPDLSRKQDQEKIIPETSLFEEKGEEKNVSRSKRSLAVNPLLDTDDDGIYDEWETNGYTIQGQLAVRWNNSMKEQNYPKYVSNPYKSHTVADPYTDWEKASGRIDQAVKREAKNPLVAAYPVVGVNMERLIVSENQNISTGLGRTVTASTSASSTAGITAGIDATVGASLLGPSGSVTAHFSYTGSSTAAVENSSSNNWSDDLGINTAHSAYLNANVRYYNTGTAPIYNVTPTTNFVLDSETIVTVRAKENQLGDVLKAGGTYPEKHLNPIALNTLDDFGSQLIPINYDQTKRLENGNKLQLQTTQASGLYGKMNSNGGLNIHPSQEWEPVRAQIESVSAGIVLDTGEEVLERRVATRDDRDPEDLTPEITIGEAIKIAFDTTEQGGKLQYKDTPLNESLVELIVDESTAREIKAQLDGNPGLEKKIYNVKLKRGMNIMLKKPIWYSDFDTHQHNWSNMTTASGEGIIGNAGKLRAGELDTVLNYRAATNYRQLKPYTKYKLSASVRFPNLETGKRINVGIQTNNEGLSENFISSNRYERAEHIFTTSNNPDNVRDLAILRIPMNHDMLFDDITLVELGPSSFGAVRAYFSTNGQGLTLQVQSSLPGEQRFDIYMNGERKSGLAVNFLALGLEIPNIPTSNLNISAEEATNPNNTFEVKFKGDTLVSFPGNS